MDLHVIIVIACVFLASLFSILFINKFFKSKTYEEAAAEKKALVEKLYPSSTKTNKKIPRKLSTKKEAKKEKKRQQQQQQQQRETTATENDSYDSDNQSFDSQSVESSPAHSLTKKLHVEFTEPEIIQVVDAAILNHQNRRASSDTKTPVNASGAISNAAPAIVVGKQAKRKANIAAGNNNKHAPGILINKTEHVLVKEQLIAEPLNHFENKPPKDMIELKKQHQQQQQQQQDSVAGEIKVNLKNLQNANQKKSIKAQQQKNTVVGSNVFGGMTVIAPPELINNKFISESPKNSGTTNKTKNNNNNNTKKKDKELSTLLEKLTSDSPTDVIGVNCLMTLFSRAELNRSDIQILIDYLLNKQQDSVVVTHSEWSDDIVQKLRKQLNEKEKALQEEQAASVGLQGKLRDLRTEINMERAQFNVNNKAYMEDILSKKIEIQNLNQELQNAHEKFQIERQQFQTKLRNDKLANSQEFMVQIKQLTQTNNLLQNDIHQKTVIANDLQLVVNASRQLVEEHNKKCNELKQKIVMLEQHINEKDFQMKERQQYDLQMSKLVENEKEKNKVELRNLQNALDSTKSELSLTKNDLLDRKSNVDILTTQLKEVEINFEILNKNLINSMADYMQKINAKDGIIADLESRHLKLTIKEDELMKIINEQKEKNNELRTKNWKLIEALKNAETTANNKITTDTSNSKNINNLVTAPPVPVPIVVQADPKIQEQKMRDLLHRLYPNEIKSITELSIDEFVDYIIAAQKQTTVTATVAPVPLNIPFTKMNSEHYNLNNNTSHNHNNVNNTKTNNASINSNDNLNKTSSSSSSSSSNINNNNNNNDNNNSSSSSSSSNSIDTRTLLLQNSQLRTRTDELTKIVTKTENMLTNLETKAREQDAYWLGIVQSKQDEINLLKGSPNGEAI